MKHVFFLSAVLFCLFASISAKAGAPSIMTFQTKIISPSGTALEAASVNFRFTILDSAGTCILYVEDYANVNMTGSQGIVAIPLGSGTKAYPPAAVSLYEVFNNATASFNCQAGGTSSPTATDNRQVVMQFNDGGGWQTLPQMAINAVPFANYATRAESLGAYVAADYLRPSTLPTCTAGQALNWDGTAFTCITPAGGGGGAYTGVTSITNASGDITLAPAAGTGAVLITSNTPSTSTSTGAIVITGGVGVSGAINTGGNITTLGSVSSAGSMLAVTSIFTPQLYGTSTPSGNIRVDGTSDATKGNVLLASTGGRVGIGVTTTPAGPLEIQASVTSNALVIDGHTSTNQYIAVDNSGQEAVTGNISSRIGFLDDVGTHGAHIVFEANRSGAATSTTSELMRITRSGDVGIGTNDPRAQLEVIATANTPGVLIHRNSSAAGSYSSLGFRNSAGAGSATAEIRALRTDVPTSGDNALIFVNNKSGGITESMRIDSYGNVGIGTSTPTYALSVSGDVNVTGNFRVNGTVLSSGGPTLSGITNISNASGDITLAPAVGTGAVQINSGSASTSPTTGALIVSGGIGVSGAIYTGGAISSGSSISATTSIYTPQLYGTSTASGNILIDGTSNATKGNVLLATAGGSVGIGTTTPSAAFHVSSASSSGNNDFFKGTDSTANNSLVLIGDAASIAGDFLPYIHTKSVNNSANPRAGLILEVEPSDDVNSRAGLYLNAHIGGASLTGSPLMVVNNDGSEKFRIDPNGNVGIGTTTPTANLEVASTKTTTSGVHAGISSVLTANPAATSTAQYVGVNSEVSTDGAQNMNSVVGVLGYASHWATGTVTNLVGGDFTTDAGNGPTTTNAIGINVYTAGWGTTPNIYGSKTWVEKLGGGVTTQVVGHETHVEVSSGGTNNLYGEKIEVMHNGGSVVPNAYGTRLTLDQGGAAAVTNFYGLYIDPITHAVAPTTKYSIYQEGADDINYFAGNMGIGVLNPQEHLHVHEPNGANDVQIRLTAGFAAYQVDIGRDSGGNFAIDGTIDAVHLRQKTGVGTPFWNPPTSWFAVKGNATIGDSYIYTAAPTDGLLIEGGVGIGVPNPTQKLQVAGIIAPDADGTRDLGTAGLKFKDIYATNNVIQTSDARMKKDIQAVDLGLDFINKLRPVSYYWKEGADQHLHYGLIAQETQQVLHEIKKNNGREDQIDNVIVTHDKATDRYGVRYTELISPLIKAVQELYSRLTGQDTQLKEQQRQIANIEAVKADKQTLEAAQEKINKLEAENAQLKSRLEKIEKALDLSK